MTQVRCRMTMPLRNTWPPAQPYVTTARNAA